MDKNEIVEIMGGLLHDTVTSLCSWLKERMPRLSMDYWDSHVVAKLSDMQLEKVRELKIKKLEGLDLAGLLRVTKGNWQELNRLKPLPDIMYDYLDAVAVIRNNWAHIQSTLPKDDQVLDQLKVLLNFLKYIDAPASVIKEVKEVISKIEKHQPLEDDAKLLNEENQDLKEENNILEGENQSLEDEKQSLENENQDLEDENQDLREEIARLKKLLENKK